MADVAEMDLDDPNQPTVTEELLQIVEEFAEYIDKFMFEIVTFLAVIDSSMGLIKDVLSMFGFSGWKMTFFPTFSFIVTIGVFLFGTNKRKGKRKADAAELEGLGQAFEMFDDVLEVVDDVLEEVEKVEGEAGGLGLGDYSDSDEDDNGDGDDENPNKTEIKEGEATDVVVDVEVSPEDGNQDPQQQDTESEPPPKSSVAKAVGMIILVARIAAKLAGKAKQPDAQTEAESSGNQNEDKTTKNAGDESQNSPAGQVTGAQVPPADGKSKLDSDTCNLNTPQEDTLVEIATDLKQESIELAKTVKDDTIKATTLVKDGTVEAGHIAHDSTKQVLASTGALKAGHGLYREVDFISAHLKKEGIAAGKTIEKETIEVANQVRGNKIVKETGVDKVGTGLYREAAFITGHLGQGTKDVIQNEEKKLTGLLVQTHSGPGSQSTDVQKVAHQVTAQKRHGSTVEDKRNNNSQTKGTRPANQTKSKTNIPNLTDRSQQRAHEDGKLTEPSKRRWAGNQVHENKTKRPVTSSGGFESKLVHENTKQASSEALKVGHGLYREVDFISGHVKKEGIATGKSLEKGTTETVDKLATGVHREAAFEGELLGEKTKNVIETEEQNLNRLFPPGPSGLVLEDTAQDINQQQTKLAAKSRTETEEEKDIIQDPDHISSEPQPGVSNMAANVVNGAAGAAGSVASEAMNIDKKAKEGLQQTQKKSKGLLPIIMRLVRLIMRVAGKGKKSAPNSQASSHRGSTASASDTPGEPAKGKRTAEGGGDAANIAGAAASLAAGGGGGKGGKIGAIVGIVVRLVRLASKLKGGQKDAPSSETRSSRLSLDEQSEDEFFDCGEEFPTTEIETQTDDMYLLSVATQTPNLDRRTAMNDSLNVDDEDEVHTEESLSKELKNIALELQAVACENATSSLGGLAERLRAIGSEQTPLLDDTNDQVTLEADDQRDPIDSRKEKRRKQLNEEDHSENAIQRITLDPTNRITLQILPSPKMGGTRTEGSSPVLIDIGGPVVVRTSPEPPPGAAPKPENISSDKQTITQKHKRKQSLTRTDSIHYEDSFQTEQSLNRWGSDDISMNSPRGSTPPSSYSKGISSSPRKTGRSSQSANQVTVEIHRPRDSSTWEPEQTNNSTSYNSASFKEYSPSESFRTATDVEMQKPQDTLYSEQRSLGTPHRTDSVNVTVNPIVAAYDSSNDDLSSSTDTSVVYRRRPSVVRFEDECTSEDIQRRQPLKSAMKRKGTAQKDIYPSYQEDDDLQSISHRQIRRPPNENNQYDEWSVVRDSGEPRETARLAIIESHTPSLIGPQLTELSGRRMNYSADDESESRESLC